MSFVARPPASQVDQPPEEETPVTNDGFFPNIDPAAVRDAARIPTSITPSRLRAAIIGAIMTVENDLRAFAAACQAAGHATLAAVPAPQLDGQSVQLIRYSRAVALFAKAELIERHPDFDTTAAGNGQAEETAPTVGMLRRDAVHAIRDILGRPRTVVESL
jgi:hypothetical protein